MTIQQVTEEIALQITTDTSRANLERCLQRVRTHQEMVRAAQAQLEKTLYEATRARELAEAVLETNQDLEARIFLLMGAAGV